VQIFGLTIARTKSLELQTKSVPTALTSVDNRGGWWPIVREPFAGAWQRNEEITVDTVLTYGAVFACVTLIASDISKMRLRLVELDGNGIWIETENPAYSPVLRRPNRFQNRIQFIESWVLSKLNHGNTYVLKQRDQRNVVTALYVLDPTRTRPLVAPDGGVYYALKKDAISQIGDDVIVPASEIIHDRMNCFFHPLVGLSPIYACGLAALQGTKIQNNSTLFFANGSQPGGVLTAPGPIQQATADRVKAKWETEFGGASNFGKVAVLGDGLKYEPMMMKFIDAQLIEQLKWTGENVCTCFRVPSYMVGIGPPPNYNNIEALNQQYYAQGLQYLVEGIELNLDEGLELKKPFGTEFDLDDLLRMDSATMMSTIKEGIGAAVMTPNEGRKKLNLGPKKGGDTPYLQQQNYSIAALDRRDKAAPAPDSSADAATAPSAAGTMPMEPPADQLMPMPAKDLQALIAAKLSARSAQIALKHAGYPHVA
jgi:HK97 family phage portal protein